MSNKNSKPETPETQSNDEVEVEPTRLQKFVTKHPRLSRALAIGGGIGTAVGVATVATNLRRNKHHLDNAVNHVEAAGDEVLSAVAPTSVEYTTTDV